MKVDSLKEIIGDIVLSFNDLDDTLERCICELLNSSSDEMGYLLVCDMSFEQRLNVYNRLVLNILSYNKKENDHKINRLKEVIKGVKECQTSRNNLIHNIRFSCDEDSDDIFIRLKYKNNRIDFDDEKGSAGELPSKGWNSQYPKYTKLTWSFDDFKKLPKKIYELADALDDIKEQIWDNA